MKLYNKNNSELVAMCAFCAVTKTVTFYNYDKYYKNRKKS